MVYFLRVWILDKVITTVKLTRQQADLIIANYKKCYKNYKIHKYNTDADVIVEDVIFKFNHMYVIITKEELE